MQKCRPDARPPSGANTCAVAAQTVAPETQASCVRAIAVSGWLAAGDISLLWNTLMSAGGL